MPSAALLLERLTLRVPEAAGVLGVGVSTMWKLVANGKVESVQVGSLRLVKVSSLKRLVGE